MEKHEQHETYLYAWFPNQELKAAVFLMGTSLRHALSGFEGQTNAFIDYVATHNPDEIIVECGGFIIAREPEKGVPPPAANVHTML